MMRTRWFLAISSLLLLLAGAACQPANPTLFPATQPAAASPAALTMTTQLPPVPTGQASALPAAAPAASPTPAGSRQPRLFPAVTAGAEQPQLAAGLQLTPAEMLTAQLAAADLAQRLGVSIQQIEVTAFGRAELPAQDLGCPPAGVKAPKNTLPGIVIGTELKLRLNAATYTYHARGRQVAFCGPA